MKESFEVSLYLLKTPSVVVALWRHLGQHAAGSGLREAWNSTKVKGVYTVSKYIGYWLAHSLRAGRMGPVPACFKPLPVGFNTGYEAKRTPERFGHKQEGCR